MATSPKQLLRNRLPEWMQDWLEIIIPGAQILLIVLAAWLLQYALRRLVNRASAHYQLPQEVVRPVKGIIRWLIISGAVLLILERMGVSATVLWTAFTGFATVGAVAFFAAWSVLSNLFCALLIFIVRPYRLGDTIEVLDTAEKAGPRGRVVDINLLYTTLEDDDTHRGKAWLQIPNTLIFQRVVRRFDGIPLPALQRSDAKAEESAAAVSAPIATFAPGAPGALGAPAEPSAPGAPLSPR